MMMHARAGHSGIVTGIKMMTLIRQSSDSGVGSINRDGRIGLELARCRSASSSLFLRGAIRPAGCIWGGEIRPAGGADALFLHRWICWHSGGSEPGGFGFENFYWQAQAELELESRRLGVRCRAWLSRVSKPGVPSLACWSAPCEKSASSVETGRQIGGAA